MKEELIVLGMGRIVEWRFSGGGKGIVRKGEI